MRPPSLDDWRATGARLTVFAVLVVGTALLRWWWAFAVVVVGGLAWLVTWHARTFGYRCPSCGHEFAISPVTDLVGPQSFGAGGAVKRLRCPSCGERGWCAVLRRD